MRKILAIPNPDNLTTVSALLSNLMDDCQEILEQQNTGAKNYVISETMYLASSSNCFRYLLWNGNNL